MKCSTWTARCTTYCDIYTCGLQPSLHQPPWLLAKTNVGDPWFRRM